MTECSCPTKRAGKARHEIFDEDMHNAANEIMRLETLVKKLQSDLDSERQYSRALEEHVKTLQESE